ncbi:hypothetical protein ARMA_2045 [Ardenticatena maritima]|uniref:Guanylate cyclase domain-containing protein n=1 Tax=Ardenticatena maritima TaxID=872965 RepID=A0A0M8K9Q8_9CHLR|nr:adenylate/guanylate cyclase domain-containing protein [Ardenticatena maritima]KPL88009.1 hypothetical protein SE16_10885 [Ardenticatena maritima]GAP63622.1 hypothetical protein ARMA_2045 [Ardenticatena maritima]
MQYKRILPTIWHELITNALHYPVLNMLLEWFVLSQTAYFLSADPYLLLVSALVQAVALAMIRENRRPALLFVANMVGVFTYSLLETTLEGMEFWQAPHHLLYWLYSLIIATCAAWHARRNASLALLGMYFARSLALLAVYSLGEYYLAQNGSFSPMQILSDPTHMLMSVAVPLLGLLGGLAEVEANRNFTLLKNANQRLHTYARWLLGDAILNELMQNPRAGEPRWRERTILFCDVRNFTAWCETESPENVMYTLEEWYQHVESVWAVYPPIRYKFTADEVMAVFADPVTALHAALRLNAVNARFWHPRGLSAGIGLHHGPVIEGLIGGEEVKYYDVLGDTVNTAQRIEKHARGQQILVSEQFYQHVPPEFEASEPLLIEPKGKAPLPVRIVHRFVEKQETTSILQS